MVELFTSNRSRFIDRLPDRTVAFLFSGEQARMSQDDEFPFLVDRNFYYLTGLEIPGLILLICKNNGNLTTRLYAYAHDDYQERWHGKRPDFEDLSAVSGISVEDITDVERFDEDSYAFIKDADLNIAIDGSSIMKAVRQFRKQVASSRGNSDLVDIKDILTRMRLIKSNTEADLIREAARITEEAIAAMKCDIVPGVTEYELHTKLEYELKVRGSELFAFRTIVSAGDNAFYLHHDIPESGDKGTVRDGSFVQIDVGASPVVVAIEMLPGIVQGDGLALSRGGGIGVEGPVGLPVAKVEPGSVEPGDGRPRAGLQAEKGEPAEGRIDAG
ncbi:MAG: aminopeptidase P family protein, partial [Clostridiales bacterium]|nr:aminopeptidase P family protein [Clostridiales bacterium]